MVVGYSVRRKQTMKQTMKLLNGEIEDKIARLIRTTKYLKAAENETSSERKLNHARYLVLVCEAMVEDILAHKTKRIRKEASNP